MDDVVEPDTDDGMLREGSKLRPMLRRHGECAGLFEQDDVVKRVWNTFDVRRESSGVRQVAKVIIE